MARMTICPPDHKHGETPTCYRSHKCACRECCDANTARCYQRKKLIAYGRYDTGMSAAAPVKAHIGQLLSGGLTIPTIAAAADVSSDTIRAIWFGRKLKAGHGRGPTPARIHRGTAERILAVQVDVAALPAIATVSSRGMRRRIQALGTLGWAPSSLARRLGISQSRMSRILSRGGDIPAALHVAAADLYEELWNVQAPSATRYDRAVRTGTIDAARRRGWLPPMAWDDIDTDDQPATLGDETVIDDVAIDLALCGEPVHLTTEERHLAIRRARARGRSLEETAELLGITARTVLRNQIEPAATKSLTIIASIHTIGCQFIEPMQDLDLRARRTTPQLALLSVAA